jgi:hypothetical protein
VNIVVKDCTFRGELGGCLPLTLPPIAELLTIVDIFFFGKTASAAPNDGEDNDVLDVAVLLPENDLKNLADRGNHGNGGYWDQELAVLFDVEESIFDVLVEHRLQIGSLLLGIGDGLDSGHLVEPGSNVGLPLVSTVVRNVQNTSTRDSGRGSVPQVPDFEYHSHVTLERNTLIVSEC